MKKKFLFILSLIQFIPFLMNINAGATVILKKSFNEIVVGSQLIIEAQVVSKEIRPSPISGKPFTYFTLEIIDVIKGSYTNPTIELGFMGGSLKGLTLKVSGMRMPEIGERGIYFINDISEQQINPLFHWQQGHYLVIINSITDQEFVVPVQDMTETLKNRGLMIQKGTPLEEFKQNINNVIRETQ